MLRVETRNFRMSRCGKMRVKNLTYPCGCETLHYHHVKNHYNQHWECFPKPVRNLPRLGHFPELSKAYLPYCHQGDNIEHQ